MAIIKLDDIAENGDKNLTGFDVQQGFVQAEKPARQWFNFLFNLIAKKVNEVVDGVNLATQAITDITINTDKIIDGAVTTEKLAADIEITGINIAKDTELNTPKLSTTYALTTLDAPNLVLAADGALKRSNDPLNASTRKVGIVAGNVVERGADGYPTNNNALGVGQTWQDMTASRAKSTTYTNSTGRPIFVSVVFVTSTTTPSAIEIDALINGVSTSKVTTYANGANYSQQSQLLIPAGATYSFTVTGTALTTVQKWLELR